MNPERWRSIEQICNQALELDPDRREHFLTEACAGDALLRKEVDSLIARQSQAQSFIEVAALEEAARALASDPRSQGDLIGQTLLHYRITGRIGTGGMGIVYRANDSRLDRPVAIKVLPNLFAQDSERLRRFEREAKVLASLNHPNIASIMGLEEVGGRSFLVLELVEGQNLEERLKKGPISVDETLRICCQIAEGLEGAHTKGIIHRDLKPANIQLTTEGRVKILDFGLAKALQAEAGGVDFSSAAPNSMTESGAILGTVAYMSPEQACGKTVDKRTDIWAFGCVLYECLTARRVFQRQTLNESVAAILRDEPDWEALPPSTPTRAVDLLRRCLRKDPKERLHDIADARIEIQEAEPERPAVAERRRQGSTGRRGMAGAVAVVLLIAAGYWAWSLIQSRDPELGELTVLPVTSYPGNEISASFSPEGREIVFAWDGETGSSGTFHIYRKLIGSDAKPLRLTSDPAGGNYPAWSPDGRSIAFLRTHEDPARKRSIMIVPPLGGREWKVAECTVGGAQWQTQWCPPPLAWTPDSRFVAIADSETGRSPHALFLVSVETGERRRLTSPAPEKGSGDSGVSFSPDGRTLALVRSTGHWSWDYFALPLGPDYAPEAEPRRLTFRNQWEMAGPTWTSGGREIVFVYGRRGAARQLWRMNPSGTATPEPIPLPGSDVHSPAISRDGDRLIYQTGFRSDSNIWKVDISESDGQPGAPTMLLASSYLENDPRFSPDGRRIVFQSNRTVLGFEIWVADANGGSPVQLTHFEAGCGGASWSPDGRQIVFDSNVHGNRSIFVVDADGGQPRTFTIHPGEEILPRWSHDGKWIYFSSLWTGEYQLWKMPAAGGEAVQLTRKGGFGSQESKDGRYLYYTRGEWDSNLWRVPTGGGDEVPIVEADVSWSGFVLKTDGIYYVTKTAPESRLPSQAPSLLRFYRFADGATQTVANLQDYFMGLSLSPDRRAVIYSTMAVDRGTSGVDLMLVENFR